MGDEEAGVQVAVRMRIFNQREKDAGATRIIRMTREDVGSKTYIENPDTGEEKEFKFDYSFNSHANDPKVGPYATQDTVFDDLGRPVMMSALEGRNVCLFAYGQTGAGKSFSMLGKSDPPAMQGIIPRTCREIFKTIEKDAKNKLIESEVGIQVVEIYCEMINDLLADRKTWPPGGFKPRMTKDGYTADTVCKPCNNYEDIESAFQFADRNRSVGSHALNPESSRAHTIYQITYQKKTKLSEDAKQCETITAKLNLVDLAGSERMESAGTSGQMLKEGNAINLSLTALGNTIKALSEGKRATFRESKLTLLLQASMTNGKVIMIAAVSPASICYDESVSTLRFAERIKLVKIKAKKNVTLDPVAEIKKEMEEMRNRMQMEIDDLKKQVGGTGSLAGSILGGGENSEELENLRKMLEEQKRAEEELRADYERRMIDMNQSKADKSKLAADINNKWKKALGGATMQKKEDIKEPHLLNLNEDARLAETLIYTLKEGDTVVGRTNKDSHPDLEFNGMGIVKHHCTFNWDKKKGTVTITPMANARCVINGKPITVATELKHNNRVWLGNNYAFRFAFPDKIVEGEAFDVPPDYLFAEAEIAEHANAASGGQMSQLSHQLSEALKKVEQANIICTDLATECMFSPKIIKSRHTGEDLVVVNVSLPNGQLVWPWDKFNVRLVEMVKLWQEWQYATQNEHQFTLPTGEANPFIDNDFQLIGEADVYLQSLANMIEHDVSPSILAPSGVTEGKLFIEINPLDRNGNEGPWEDDSDLDPFVDDVKELEGKEIKFVVKINKAVFEVNLKEGGHCRYRDTWVRFKIDASDYSEDFTVTPPAANATIEPNYSFSQKFTKIVDSKLMQHLSNGKMLFQVWGKLADRSPNTGTITGMPLPDGWKKVTAYQDPQGNLHLHPPRI